MFCVYWDDYKPYEHGYEHDNGHGNLDTVCSHTQDYTVRHVCEILKNEMFLLRPLVFGIDSVL